MIWHWKTSNAATINLDLCKSMIAIIKGSWVNANMKQKFFVSVVRRTLQKYFYTSWLHVTPCLTYSLKILNLLCLWYPTAFSSVIKEEQLIFRIMFDTKMTKVLHLQNFVHLFQTHLYLIVKFSKGETTTKLPKMEISQQHLGNQGFSPYLFSESLGHLVPNCITPSRKMLRDISAECQSYQNNTNNPSCEWKEVH